MNATLGEASTSKVTLATPAAVDVSSADSTSHATSRARTHSIGANVRSLTSKRTRAGSIASNDVQADGSSLDRGPGTPDFTIGRFDSIRGVRGKTASIPFAQRSGSQLRSVVAARGDVADEELLSGQRDADKKSKGESTRPRLSTQIRSLFSSWASSTDDQPSSFSRRVGGSQSAERFQPLTVTAESLRSHHDRSIPLQRPQALAMPAARQASVDGARGLNEDSPPLTPAGSDERGEWDREDDEIALASERSSIWTPFSASAFTSTSLDTSGRTSPVASLLNTNHLHGFLSPSGRPLKKNEQSLLPSHAYSPPASPASLTHAASHAQQSSFSSHDARPVPFDGLLHSFGNASTAMLSNLRSFFFAAKMPPLRPHLPALFFLLITFVGSTLCVLLALSTLPLRLPSHITDLTLAEIREMSLSLRAYSRSSPRAFAHTLAVLGAFFTWKQSFTIPGSIIMNVIFGAMYGTWKGTLFTCVLTSVGGMFCYLLVAPLGPLVSAMPGLSKGLQKMRDALQVADPTRSRISSAAATSRWQNDDSSVRRMSTVPVRRSSRTQKASMQRGAQGSLWSYLLVLRLLPVVPYGLMNIACSVLRVPLLPYTVTLGLGSIPWNACTVQIGDLLVEVVSALPVTGLSSDDVASQLGSGGFYNAPTPTSNNNQPAFQPNAIQTQSGIRAITEKVWNREMMFKLLLMSVISLAPLLLQRILKRKQAASGEDFASEHLLSIMDDEDVDEDARCTSAADEIAANSIESGRSEAHGCKDDDGGRTSANDDESLSLFDPRSWRSSWHSSMSHHSERTADIDTSRKDSIAGRTYNRYSANAAQFDALGAQRTPSTKRAVADALV